LGWGNPLILVPGVPLAVFGGWPGAVFVPLRTALGGFSPSGNSGKTGFFQPQNGNPRCANKYSVFPGGGTSSDLWLHPFIPRPPPKCLDVLFLRQEARKTIGGRPEGGFFFYSGAGKAPVRKAEARAPWGSGLNFTKGIAGGTTEQQKDGEA